MPETEADHEGPVQIGFGSSRTRRPLQPTKKNRQSQNAGGFLG